MKMMMIDMIIAMMMISTLGSSSADELQVENFNMCRIKEVSTTGIRPFSMCLRPQNDALLSGNYDVCSPIWTLWKQIDHNAGNLFVDVGAKFGSCSLLMAAGNVSTAAFESFPENLLYFKKSILLNKFEDRITLYSTALGLRSPIQYNKGSVRRLDDVLWADRTVAPPVIDLMNIDANSLNIDLLKGGKNLLHAGAVKVINMELARNRAHNGTALLICHMLLEYSLCLFNLDGKSISLETCQQFDADTEPYHYIIARYIKDARCIDGKFDGM